MIGERERCYRKGRRCYRKGRRCYRKGWDDRGEGEML